MTDLRQAMLALADEVDHPHHIENEEGDEICRDCPSYVGRYYWPCVHHKYAEKIRAAVKQNSLCTCGDMLGNPEIRCDLHPDVRTRTREEKAEFARKWDQHVKGVMPNANPS